MNFSNAEVQGKKNLKRMMVIQNEPFRSQNIMKITNQERRLKWKPEAGHLQFTLSLYRTLNPAQAHGPARWSGTWRWGLYPSVPITAAVPCC